MAEVKERLNALMQERQKHARLVQLRRDTLRRIDFLRRKPVLDHHETYQLVRDFFKEFLDKHYEFTINELRAELKTVYISNGTRQLVEGLLERLEVVEYTSVNYIRDDVLKLLDDFQTIVQQLVRVHLTPHSWIERVKMLLSRDTEPLTVIAELPVLESPDVYFITLHTLVEKCYIALDKHKIGKAKAVYTALLAEYNLLDEESKKRYYPLIDQTYRDMLARKKMMNKEMTSKDD